MIAGIATHSWLLDRVGRYLVGAIEVLIYDNTSKEIRTPTAFERHILDAHFTNPATRDPSTGEIFSLRAASVPGIVGAVFAGNASPTSLSPDDRPVGMGGAEGAV